MIHTLDLRFQIDHAIASFVVESSAGPILIETGPHSTFEQLKTGLFGLGYRPEDVRHVLLTHIHFDHAGAAWAFADHGAQVYVHPVGAPHLAAPHRLYESARRIYGDQMEELWGDMRAIPETQLHATAHNTQISVGGRTFVAHHTPGHASHHIAWELEGERTVFTGDVAGVKIQDGPVVPPCPPPDISIELWLDSLNTLRAIQPKQLYLTHFGKVTEIESHLTDLEKILMDWANWIKAHMEQGLSAEEMRPQFSAYTTQQLRERGLSSDAVARYEAANPSWMSVAGLMRYWKKRNAA